MIPGHPGLQFQFLPPCSLSSQTTTHCTVLAALSSCPSSVVPADGGLWEGRAYLVFFTSVPGATSGHRYPINDCIDISLKTQQRNDGIA